MHFLSQVADWFTTASHWHGTNGIPHRLTEHVLMSGAVVLAAVVLTLPIGVWLGHLRRFGFLAINVSNVGRAIPSFALLVIALQLFGIGAIPAFVALVALGIPPMVTNAYVGMRSVDPELRELTAHNAIVRALLRQLAQ